MTNTFNPLDFGFDKLDLQHGSLRFYEYRSGDFCDGKVNPHRINVYLTQDGDFVTVWDGLFDTAFVSQAFHDLIGKVGLGDVDFFATYHTPLFRDISRPRMRRRLSLRRCALTASDQVSSGSMRTIGSAATACKRRYKLLTIHAFLAQFSLTA
jgi:hypothetical protein